ncbi:hypothetical protein RA281_27320, partial [Pseudomonas syringae pv. tagetis]
MFGLLVFCFLCVGVLCLLFFFSVLVYLVLGLFVLVLLLWWCFGWGVWLVVLFFVGELLMCVGFFFVLGLVVWVVVVGLVGVVWVVLVVWGGVHGLRHLFVVGGVWLLAWRLLGVV